MCLGVMSAWNGSMWRVQHGTHMMGKERQFGKFSWSLMPVSVANCLMTGVRIRYFGMMVLLIVMDAHMANVQIDQEHHVAIRQCSSGTRSQSAYHSQICGW